MNDIPKLTKEAIYNMSQYMEQKRIAPCMGGFWVFRTTELVDDELYKYAIGRKILINPNRETMIEHCPRQVYYCDHCMDKIEDGYIVIENENVFWKEHEDKYQLWLKEVLAK